VKLKEGESNGTVRLVRLDSPWGARLEWKGVEFDVGLFERDKIVMPAPQPASPSSETSGASPGSRLSATASLQGEESEESRKE